MDRSSTPLRFVGKTSTRENAAADFASEKPADLFAAMSEIGFSGEQACGRFVNTSSDWGRYALAVVGEVSTH